MHESLVLARIRRAFLMALRTCLHGVTLALLGGSPFYKGIKMAPFTYKVLSLGLSRLLNLAQRETFAWSLSSKQPKWFFDSRFGFASSAFAALLAKIHIPRCS